MPETETRIIAADSLEWRAAGDGEDGPTISGYGAVFNSPSLDLGGVREIVAPGAFSRSLKSREDIRSFFNHNPSMPLGSRKAGNLTVEEDEHGLRYVISPLPATSYANDVAEAIRAGLVRGSSFTFMIRKDEWHEENGVQIRTLLDVDVPELGPVTMPAYVKATTQVRALLESRGIRLEDDQPESGCDLLAVIAGWRDRDEPQLRAALAATSALIDELWPELPPALPPPRLATLRRRLELLKRAH